ncbi:MAG: glycosyltransferase family 39 protein [Patescibacteria group bacterium]|nr:glycosyltransferase family 39 protein [Patescibacteria group bacterium]
MKITLSKQYLSSWLYIIAKTTLYALPILLFLDITGIQQISTYFLLIFSLLAITIIIYFERKNIFERYKKEVITHQLTTLISLVAVGYLFIFLFFGYGNPLQFIADINYEQHKNFVALQDSDHTLSTTIQADLNHFGSFDLIFRPITFEIQQNEEELNSIVHNAEITFEDYLVQIFADNQIVYSHTYGVPAFDELHVYPVGFIPDENSRGRSFTIKITKVSEEAPLQEVAVTRERDLFINPKYVITKSQIVSHYQDLISFFTHKSQTALKNKLHYLFIFVGMSVFLLYSSAAKPKRKAASFALGSLTLYYILHNIARFTDLTIPTTLAEYSGLMTLIGMAFVAYAHRPQKQLTTKSKSKSLKWSDWLFIILSCVVFISFGTHHLGQFMSVDEPKWLHSRVPQLYESVQKLDFAGTYINDKPGIVPAALAGIVNLFTSWENFDPFNREVYLFWWRLPIILFNTSLLPLAYWLVLQLLSRKTAQIFLVLLITFPQLIGMSQIVNPDATLWSLGLISALYFLKYLKDALPRDATWAGVFLGLALLSKFFAVVLYLSFFFLLYYLYISSEHNKALFAKRLWQLCRLIGISIIVYTMFFPATWINPTQILKGTIAAGIIKPAFVLLLPVIGTIFADVFLFKSSLSKFLHQYKIATKATVFVASFLTLLGLGLIINMFLGFPFFDWEAFRQESQRWQSFGYGNFLSSSSTLLFSLPEAILVGLIISITLFFSKKVNISITEKKVFLLALFSWLILILGAVIVGVGAGIRYQILILPLLTLAAAILYSLFFSKKHLIFMVVLTTISLGLLIQKTPFYLHYSNILNTQSIVISEAWGFGGYELAQQLNSLPNAQNLTVWSDREGFNEFFVGTSYWRGNTDPFQEEKNIDFLILTEGGKNIFMRAIRWDHPGLYKTVGNKLVLEHKLYEKKPNFEFCINLNDCYKAIKLKN